MTIKHTTVDTGQGKHTPVTKGSSEWTEEHSVKDGFRVPNEGSNYADFDNDGRLTFKGLARPYDDLRIEPIARTTGANAPTFEKWYDDSGNSSRGVYLYSFDDAVAGSEKEIHFTMQMPHSWDLATFDLHVHWIGAVNDTIANPIWGIEYVWRNVGSVFGDTKFAYTSEHISTDGVDVNVTAHKHYISEFDVSPDSDNSNMSSILIGRLFRNSASSDDTYNAAGAKCGLLYIDGHIRLKSLGSSDEYS